MAISLVAVLAACASAFARTQTAQSGTVSARYSFSGRFPTYRDERLSITRAGVVAYDEPVTSSFCGTGCAPGAPEAGASSLQIADLNADGELEVLLSLYSGGAHCCSIMQVFAFDPSTGGYVSSEHDFGDSGARLEDLGPLPGLKFVTSDDRFAYAFTDFAHSGLPLQILAFEGGRFVAVTRQYPALIARDAARWWRAFRHSHADGVGLIAAWAADQYLLGHRALVHRTLARQARLGHLHSGVGPVLPSGRKFVRALYRFLRRHGYGG